MTTAAAQLVDALGAGIAARDAERIRTLYADNIRVWHGATGVAQTKDENIGLLTAVFGVTSSLEYRDIVRHEFDGGLVQQHRLCGTFADGTPMPDLYACLIFEVADGKITKIDEYFDSAQFTELAARLGMTA